MSAVNSLWAAALGVLALAACQSQMQNATEFAPQRDMVIIRDADVRVDEPPPHGGLGMSTAWRISDVVDARTFEFRKRALHRGAAIGLHPLTHDEVYHVLSGAGVVESDGQQMLLTTGMTAYLYTGSTVGIRQQGAEPLLLIIAYPPALK